MSDVSRNKSFTVPCIGYASSPYGEKFAVPRQPGLAPHILTTLHFYPPYDDPAAFRGLEGFSHIIVLFVFDRANCDRFRPTVRPPRLGGNTRMGVFATRSPFRPSRIGMSVVKLERMQVQDSRTTLEISGADLVDGTPIVDIKPYIAFADAVPGAASGFAAVPPPHLEVAFETQALKDLQGLGAAELEAVTETMAQDPRPAYQHDEDERVYGVLMFGFNLSFRVRNGTVHVLKAERIGN